MRTVWPLRRLRSEMRARHSTPCSWSEWTNDLWRCRARQAAAALREARFSRVAAASEAAFSLASCSADFSIDGARGRACSAVPKAVSAGYDPD